MGMKSGKPEQDPAEGSRETIDHELARQGGKDDKGASETSSKGRPSAGPDDKR